MKARGFLFNSDHILDFYPHSHIVIYARATEEPCSFDNFLCILSDFMTKNYVKKIDSNKIFSPLRQKIAFLYNFA